MMQKQKMLKQMDGVQKQMQGGMKAQFAQFLTKQRTASSMRSDMGSQAVPEPTALSINI